MDARLAVMNDEAAVSALLLASYGALMAKDYEAELLGAALRVIGRANPSLLVSGSFYVVDGPGASLIGCGGWTLEAPDSKTQTAALAHLRHFCTHPAFARRGVGRLIYDRCVEAATSAGVNTFQVYASLTAVSFYASMGLHIIRSFELPLAGGIKFPAVLMEGKV